MKYPAPRHPRRRAPRAPHRRCTRARSQRARRPLRAGLARSPWASTRPPCRPRPCAGRARCTLSARAPFFPRRIGSQFLGKYSDSVPAAFVYPSSNFEDDLAWGATWLFRKTGEQHFLAVRARRPAGPARSAA